MVISGKECSTQASTDIVAQKTIDCLKSSVPEELPGIVFLSGGQTDIQATAHLNAMNKIGGFPWKLSFSYGRALQSAALKAWEGKDTNLDAAQEAFNHRAAMNSKASLGLWEESLEK